MGLSAFNRMRRLQAEAEKQKEGVKDGNNDTPKSKKRPANKREQQG